MNSAVRVATCAVLLGSLPLVACQATKPPAVRTPAQGAPVSAPRDPPELKAITFRHDVPNGRGIAVSVVPDFYFVAPKGNVIGLHREMVATTGSTSRIHLNPMEAVDIAPEVQRKGAVISGGWQCGVAQYQVTIRAYLIDADGARSNSMDYTIHCNGG
jgi:hypothetical protein